MAIHAFGLLVKNKALQIATDNISAMANINHMRGQSPLLTLITEAILAINLHQCLCCGRGEISSFFVYKKR